MVIICDCDNGLVNSFLIPDYKYVTLLLPHLLLQELMDYLDDHRDYYKDLLKKKKRQELENGGVISFLKAS